MRADVKLHRSIGSLLYPAFFFLCTMVLLAQLLLCRIGLFPSSGIPLCDTMLTRDDLV